MTDWPMWHCPKCGRRFANRNQWHSCGPYTVETFLAGKSAYAVSLYRRFEAHLLGLADVTLAPAKTRIGFQARMIFAAVNALRDRYMDVHICLTRRVDSPRFQRIEPLSPTMYVHHLRIGSLGEIDAELAAWLREAHAAGRRAPAG